MVRWNVGRRDLAAADGTRPDRHTVGALGGMLALAVLVVAPPVIAGAF
jgi:hypothetical protein